MKALNHATLGLIFVYFLLFLTGSPGFFVPLQHAYEDEIYADFQRLTDPDEANADNQLKLEPEAGSAQFFWRPGLIELVAVHSRLLGTFEDELLESDARPDALFRAMERSLTSNVTYLSFNAFWCFVIALCWVALHKNHWFYRNMSALVLGLTIVVLIIVLMVPRAAELNRVGSWPPEHWVRAIFEWALVACCTIVLFSRALPDRAITPVRAFMDHMRTRDQRATDRARSLARSIVHVVLVSLAGIVIANVLLLPIYMMQLGFPGLFAFLLIAGLLALAYFYVRAYLNVVHAQKHEAGIVSSISFLGYRMLRNTIVLLSMIFTICLVLTLIVIVLVQNSALLESLSLIKSTGGI